MTTSHIPHSVNRPPALLKTGRIAVAAPSSAALDSAHVEAGLEVLRSRGLHVEAERAFVESHGYLSGTDEERLDEMNEFLRRDDLEAIICLRGGFGALRILDRLDYDAMRAHPKLLVGYSDITAFQLAFWKKSGVPSLSAAMVATDWRKLSNTAEKQFWTLVSGESEVALHGPDGESLTPLRSGDTSGTLIGGNLSALTALLGTPYWPNTSGAILFVEDVDEPPYRIDYYLSQLHLTGVLDEIGGLVFGAFTHTAPRPDRPTLDMEDVIGHYASFVNGPVAKGLVYGHFPNKTPMPIGIRARLVVSKGEASLTTLEPLTVAAP